MDLPLYVSPINQTISDRHGNKQELKASVAVFITRPLVDIALAAGVVLCDARVPAIEGLTTEEVAAGIRKLMEAGDPKAFTADGEPKLAQLRKVLGAAVTDAQRDDAWELVKSEA